MPDHQHIVCTKCGAVNRAPIGSSLAKGHCGSCKGDLASHAPVEINTKILNRLMSRDEGSFLLDVWAPWCGPCRMMAPSFAEAAKYFDGNLRFLKLNTEAHPEGGAALNVRGIPALLLFQDGSVIDQRSGVMTAPTIIQWVDSLKILKTNAQQD